jgi:hypothetical protein
MNEPNRWREQQIRLHMLRHARIGMFRAPTAVTSPGAQRPPAVIVA